MNPAPIRRRITYHGRVQGVGFRATAVELARGRPLTGWVRNVADGTVELEVQGPPDDVQAHLDAIAERMGRNISRTQAASIPAVSGEHAFELRW